MTTPRQESLTPDELALKLATDAAVKAAGGQVFVAEQLRRTQSAVSDWCSRTTRSFVPLNCAATIDALGTGSPGAPHIARALARSAGLCLPNPDQDCAEPGGLSQWLAEVAGESGDVIKALAAGMVMPGNAAASVRAMAPERMRMLALEIDQLVDVLAGLNAVLGKFADSS